MAKRKSKSTKASSVRSAAKSKSFKLRSGKKQMTEEQEFEIMKLVLDKFLWLGFIVMGFGMYQSLSSSSIAAGIWYIIAGAVLLLLFLWIIVKEYEFLESH